MKKTTILYLEWKELIHPLSDESAGKIFKNILSLASGEDIKPTTDPVWNFIRMKVLAHAEDYAKYCQKNREISLSRFKKTDTNACDGNRTISNDIERHPKEKEKEKDNKREGNTPSFTKPSINELTEFIREHKFSVDPSTFLNFYESKGWMIGKNKMKDWRAAVRTWEQKNKLSTPSSKPVDKPKLKCCFCQTEIKTGVMCKKCEERRNEKTQETYLRQSQEKVRRVVF